MDSSPASRIRTELGQGDGRVRFGLHTGTMRMRQDLARRFCDIRVGSVDGA
jgi:hypothetical protein